MARGCARPASIWRSAMLSAGACTLVAGCAHTPEWVPWYEPQAAQEAPAVPAIRPTEEQHKAPRRTEHHAQKAEPPAKVAMVEPATLVGKRRSQVTQLLGAPARIANEQPSLVWIYEADGCALKIYFYPDLKTSAFHVLKFSLADADGKPLDAQAPCRRKLLAMKENDTG